MSLSRRRLCPHATEDQEEERGKAENGGRKVGSQSFENLDNESF